MMDQLTFAIHGLVRLTVECPERRFAAMLLDRWERFLVEGAVSEPADVVMDAWEPAVRAQGKPPHGGLSAPAFHVFQGSGDEGFCAVWYYRGREDVWLDAGVPIRLCYRRRPGQRMVLYGLLLLALRIALRRAGGFLCHGAMLARDGRGLLLAGPNGTRKTLLQLELLRQGWSYLADDKFVLREGVAFPFEQKINLRPHHVRALPWLREQDPEIPRFMARAGRTEKLRSLLMRLPRSLRALAVRLAPAPCIRLEVARLVEGAGQLEQTPVTHAVLLGLGSESGLRACDRPLAQAAFGHSQWFQFRDYAHLLELLAYYGHLPPLALEEVAQELLPEIPWLRYTSGVMEAPARGAERIGQWAEQED